MERGSVAIAADADTREAAPRRREPRVALGAAEPRVGDVLPEIVEASPTAIGLMGRDRHLAYQNGAWFDLFDGDSLDVADVGDPVAAALGGAASRSEARAVRRRDGTIVRVLLSVMPVVDRRDEVIGAIVYAEPIDRAAASTLRDAFLGVLSHELRTPITSIYGGSQLLLRDVLSPESRADVLAGIAAEAERLYRRVEDFLVLARVECGADHPGREAVLIQAVIRSAVVAERRRSSSMRFIVRLPRDLPPVEGDQAHVAQVVRNLLAIAVDASPPNGPIVIEASTDGRWVEVGIKDRGPQGAPNAVELSGDDTFRLFYRHPTVGGHVPGAGLGLYVAHALVEVNQGRIWRKVRRGGGIETRFTLPLYGVDAGG